MACGPTYVAKTAHVALSQASLRSHRPSQTRADLLSPSRPLKVLTEPSLRDRAERCWAKLSWANTFGPETLTLVFPFSFPFLPQLDLRIPPVALR